MSAACLILTLTGSSATPVHADHGQSPLTFSLSISAVTASGGCIDDWGLGCGNADFYPVVSLNSGANQKYPYADDDDSITPNWLFPKAGTSSHPGLMQRRADFKIEIWDRDGGLLGDDDHIDIHPGASRDLIGHIEWDFDDAQPDNTFTFTRLVVDGANPDGGDFVTNFGSSPPAGFELQNIQFSGNAGDRATITLDFSLVAGGGIPIEEAGDVIRPLGIHSPIHPEPTDMFEITGGLVDEFGDRVNYDTIEIWVDEDGRESTKNDRYNLLGTPGGTCWAAGSNIGSTCTETVNLASISESPDLGPEEQRMFSYGVKARNSATHTGWIWSGWRSLTVGNRTNEDFIGFSIGTGNPKNAVDLLYTPQAVDYGAQNCSMEPFLLPNQEWPVVIPACEIPVDKNLFSTAVEDNWKNSFFTSVDWSVIRPNFDTPAHVDVISSFQSRFNFWYTTEPGIGSGMVENWYGNSCEVSTPKKIVDGVVKSIAPFVDTEFLLHVDGQPTWRDCAPGGGKRVTITQASYPTTLHELGHRPFGAADIYCCDGGYYQRSAFPNLYAEREPFSLWVPGQAWLEGANEYSWGDKVPGCDDEPLLGSPGIPVPNANSAPCPQVLDPDPEEETSSDWFMPEPTGSLMGIQWTPMNLPDGRVVFAQPGPSTYHRFIWYLGMCDGGNC